QLMDRRYDMISYCKIVTILKVFFMAHSASAGLLMFQGSLANLAKCTLRGDCLGVDEAMHDGWFTAFQGALYCWPKFISLGDPFAVPTKGLGIGCKIRVLQLRS